jgi:succinoglycan biosynthesis protein ExoA
MTATVTIILPVLDEEEYLDRSLASIAAQTYTRVIDVLVVDGGSTDRTVEIAESYPFVRVIDNPDRLQAAALNLGLAQARGEIIVRVDGHCELAPDYVERSVAALERTGAAMVGGAMRPVGHGSTQRAIAAAMTSRFGASPARFHVGGKEGSVDTVYLGSYRTGLARRVGGYAPECTPNEDAEFAHRMGRHGVIWFDPTILSTYTPRASIPAVARQFYRYGQGRARTARRHPASLHVRQLAAPALVAGLLSPNRRKVALAYGALVLARTGAFAFRDRRAAPSFLATLPTMHLAWGVGFLQELITGGGSSPERAAADPVEAPQFAPRQRAAFDGQRQAGTPGAQPRPDVSGSQCLEESATRPHARVQHRDRQRQMATHEEQSVLPAQSGDLRVERPAVG